jgi:ABC-type sugar transport system substrate-binding protein
MKMRSLSIFIATVLLTMILSACGNQIATETPADVTPPPVISPELNETKPTQLATLFATATSQATPLPTATPEATPLPTAIPEPIPCTIAFDSDRDGNHEIYRMDSDGNELINLSNNPADDIEPAWSPDGSQIAFSSDRVTETGGGHFIYIMNADGSGLRQLSEESESRTPNWSNDGAMITYEANGDIYLIQADGSSPALNLTNSPGKDFLPKLSANGSQIAWILLSNAPDRGNVFVMNVDGSNVRQLTDNGQQRFVDWTIDGRLFIDSWGWKDQQEFCHNCVFDSDGANIVDAGGKGEIMRFKPYWTLDGKRVEAISGSILTDDEEIYLVSGLFPDTFLNLTKNPGNDRNPAWPANCLQNREPLAEISQEDPISPEIVIGYAEDEAHQSQRSANFQQACSELGIQCIFGTLPELTQQGVSAIVQNANELIVQEYQQDILNARDRGIPVFLLDVDSSIDGVYSISVDHDRWIYTSLKWLLDTMGGKGQFAYFDLNPYHRYSDMIEKVLSEYPEVTVVEKRDGKYNADKIKPEFSDFVRHYPDLKGVWTSYNNFHTIMGMEENGIPYETWPHFVCDDSLDCLLKWDYLISVNPEFQTIALGNPPGIAYDAVYAAYYLVTGAEIDAAALSGPYGNSLYVDFPSVNNDNLLEWIEIMTKNHYDQLDQLMTPEEIREKWFKN